MRDRIKNAFHGVLGTIIVDYHILGIPVYIVRKRDAWHFDYYLFCIPLLRVSKEPRRKDISLLIFTWIHKAIKYLFTKWTLDRTSNGICLKFAGHKVYQEYIDRPFRFPTADFRA